MKKLVYIFIFLMIFHFGCDGEENQFNNPIQFRSLKASNTGIKFNNSLSYKTSLNIIEYLYYYNGGGVAVGDINNDGLEDIFFSGNLVSDKLYLNLGDMKFEDISSNAGLIEDNSWSNGVNFEDINGDGLLDIYVTKVGPISPSESHNLLYINNGDLTFTEKSSEFGLDFSGFSTQATFFDYDQDGDLDMYLMNHAIHTVRSYGTSKKRLESDKLSGDKFYENKINENEAKFVDVTKQSKIYDSPLGYGLAITATDINNDGWMDLYIGNDFHENDYIYINNKDKTFTESVKKSLSHMSHFTMGIDVADLNSDGHLDIFTTDMMPYDSKIFLKSGGEDEDKISRIKKEFGFEPQFSRNHFQLNRGDGTYSEIAVQNKTHATDWSWGVLLQDFDSDGFNDIFISNGIFKRPNDLDYIKYLSNVDFTKYNNYRQDIIKKKLIDKMPTLEIKNILFRNKGNLKFESIENSFIGKPSYSNGAAYSDFDKDGDLDIVVNNLNSNSEILENVSSPSNFLSIKLKGNNTNKIVRGSRLNVYSEGKNFVKENIITRGFQSSSSHYIFFGLGDLKKIDSIKIRWPDGFIQKEENIEINKEIEIQREEYLSKKYVEIKKNSNFELKIIPIKHNEDIFYDYERERLIPEKLSHEGPAVLKADFNKDGFNDIFLGGGQSHISRILFGSKNGSMSTPRIQAFEKDKLYEDVDAQTLDIDNDGDLDLYVVSGGAHYKEMDKFMYDRIYINDGNGEFTRLDIPLPSTNGSTVSVSDINKDGYDDLFVGSRSIPGSYGLSPYSFILLNTKNNSFKIIAKERYGMITDSQWADFNNDGKDDLIMVGDWMPIRILINTGDLKFVDKTNEYGLSKTNGLWNTLLVKDFNLDGSLDFIAGNAGTNLKWKPTIEKPVKLFLDDFDGNKQLDPIIFYDFFGKYVPFSSKDKLDKQIPLLKKKFPNYINFSNVKDLRSLTGKNDNEILETKYLYNLNSSIFINQKGKFISKSLPQEVQLSTIEDFSIINHKPLSLIYVGNYNHYLTELGSASANPGGLLTNFNVNSLEFDLSETLSLPISLESRRIIEMKNDFYIFSNNGYIYSLSKNK
tara:strand:+ start:3206 stop:6460 length:3255 start_codon:yes stop_codon:yes gene_type:complete